MGDLNTLHTHAKRLIIALKEGLEQLESAEVRLCPGKGESGLSSGLVALYEVLALI